MISFRHTMSSHIFILLGLVRSLSADTNHTPLETMADVTNDFGVCVLQIIASPEVNTVFSPYGLMSMALLVYEGTRGQAAAEIYNTLHLPWHRDIVRIGFRDLHRYLRSYFSSEGFLKGLVLSKPNVALRPSYVEVLKFYGFQSDTSITQPTFTTQASIGNRENGNETTTTLPETTSQLPTTPITTMKPVNETKTMKPVESGSTVPTTVLETTTNIMTVTDKPQTQPDILSMQGPEGGETTLLPPTTTILTTIISETTKREAMTTESMDNATTGPPEKTTVQVETTTKEAEPASEETPTETTSQEVKTETSTPEMDVVTMTNPTVSALKSMNMILNLNNKTEETETDTPEINSEANLNNTMNETDTSTFKTTLSDLISVVTNEITTREVFTQQTETETITLFFDTTLPVEEVTILSTPLDVEVVSEIDSPIFEAVVLLDENKEGIQHADFTSESSPNKRSTESNVTGEPPLLELTTPTSTLYSILNKTHSSNQGSTDTWSIIGDKDQTLINSVISNLIGDIQETNSTLSELENAEEFTETSGDQSQLPSDDLAAMTGFPTLEPDTIIFPKVTESRLTRSVKNEEKPAELGNWVGSSGWHPSPTDQWFWTYTGDKLVPVLTYTALLPYTDLPALSATAIQLPLDDVRYTLMILLPRNARGLKQMVHSLQWCPLRSILKLFKPTPLYAVVPTFTIVKHINLTPALHKLGIRNIFDAYLANLCEMSEEPNLYVRTIEQVITISIQKYFTNQNWIESSPAQVEQHFLATHPFAYFVIDIETKVALVAGTIVDPLERNS